MTPHQVLIVKDVMDQGKKALVPVAVINRAGRAEVKIGRIVEFFQCPLTGDEMVTTACEHNSRMCVEVKKAREADFPLAFV